ncbi:hypothetical protein WL34_01690 [Burkholderia cepacia]|nr:hypothetical protein WL34_01690 [Burkholderia cepacia]
MTVGSRKHGDVGMSAQLFFQPLDRFSTHRHFGKHKQFHPEIVTRLKRALQEAAPPMFRPTENGCCLPPWPAVFFSAHGSSMRPREWTIGI